MTRSDGPNSGWTRTALLAAIVLSSSLVTFNRQDAREASANRLASQDASVPLAQLVAIPVSAVEGFFGSVSDRSRAFEENKALRARIADLEDRQVRYENLAMKVARYEAIIGVDTETDVPLRKITARAIGETDGPFVRSLLLNVGRPDGVEIGNPVLSVHGLVGHVINTGRRSTRVLRLTDLNSRISVASARSDATAILAGDNTDVPKLSFINQGADWQVGDRVITSGDDGALPRGLYVGEVVSSVGGGLRVALGTQGKGLDWVWVSPFTKVVAPEEIESDDAEEITQ